jgi:hypothetical protein
MNLKDFFTDLTRKAKAFNPNSSMTVKIFIILAVVVLITMMFPTGESIEFDYRIGAIWGGEDIIAPFSFPIYKDDRQYEREKEEAELAVIPVFNRDDTEGEHALDSVRVLFDQLRLAAEIDIEYRRKRAALKAGETALRTQVEQDSVVLSILKVNCLFSSMPKNGSPLSIFMREEFRKTTGSNPLKIFNARSTAF